MNGMEGHCMGDAAWHREQRDDIVKRLREVVSWHTGPNVCKDAADEIEKLRNQIDLLREVLEGCLDEYGFVSKKYHDRVKSVINIIEGENNADR